MQHYLLVLGLCSGEAGAAIAVKHGAPLVQGQPRKLYPSDALALQVLILREDAHLPADGFCCQFVVTCDDNDLQTSPSLRLVLT